MANEALLTKSIPYSARDVHLEDQAHAELRALPYGALRRTSCQVENNCLILKGVVPTFHQKQLAQEHLQKCFGTGVSIANELQVQPKHPGSKG